MLGEFETIQIDGERLFRVACSIHATASPILHGRTMAVLCLRRGHDGGGRTAAGPFDIWRDVVPCWKQRIRTKFIVSPIEALMEEYGASMTRDEYIRGTTSART